MPLALLALAIATFGAGTAEFVMIGLLPEAASDMGVSISEAGGYVSFYSLGVVIGAPLLTVVGMRVQRKTILLAMTCMFIFGNTASALVPSHELLLAARFAAGLPHGVFFGIGAVVAAGLVAPERRGRALSVVLVGVPMANIVGSPLGTLLGQTVGWLDAGRSSWSPVSVSSRSSPSRRCSPCRAARDRQRDRARRTRHIQKTAGVARLRRGGVRLRRHLLVLHLHPAAGDRGQRLHPQRGHRAAGTGRSGDDRGHPARRPARRPPGAHDVRGAVRAGALAEHVPGDGAAHRPGRRQRVPHRDRGHGRPPSPASRHASSTTAGTRPNSAPPACSPPSTSPTRWAPRSAVWSSLPASDSPRRAGWARSSPWRAPVSACCPGGWTAAPGPGRSPPRPLPGRA